MSRSTPNVFEAVQKTHSMCFGVETLSYASLMNVLYPIKHFCLNVAESNKMLVWGFYNHFFIFFYPCLCLFQIPVGRDLYHYIATQVFIQTICISSFLHCLRVSWSSASTWRFCHSKIESGHLLICIIFTPAKKASWTFFCLGMHSVGCHILPGMVLSIAVPYSSKLNLAQLYTVVLYFVKEMWGAREKFWSWVQESNLLVTLVTNHDYMWFIAGSTSQHYTGLLADGLGTVS